MSKRSPRRSSRNTQFVVCINVPKLDDKGEDEGKGWKLGLLHMRVPEGVMHHKKMENEDED